MEKTSHPGGSHCVFFSHTFHFFLFLKRETTSALFSDSQAAPPPPPPKNSFLATMSSVCLLGSSPLFFFPLFLVLLLNSSRPNLIFPAMVVFRSQRKTDSSVLQLECDNNIERRDKDDGKGFFFFPDGKPATRLQFSQRFYFLQCN